MNELWAAVKVGSSTGIAMFAAESMPIEDGKVSVVVAVTCTVFICGIVWWLASRFQRIDDRLHNIEKRFESLPCDKTQEKCK